MADNPLVATANDTCTCEGLQCSTDSESNSISTSEPVRLKFLTHTRGAWTQPIARAFEEYMNGAVIVEINDQVAPVDLFPNIINEAVSQIGLYDGFFTNPTVTGSVVEYNGFADLTPFIGETAEKIAEWDDILLGYRKWVAQYEKKIVLFPVDGDIFSMFYRRDVLKAFNLTVPRTWEEYTAVAAAVHNQTFEGKVLTGSCIGRSVGCAGAYWANLVISSYTQTHGASTGHLFDTADMTSLTGPVLEEALLMLEMQAKYGSEDEFDKCIGPVNIEEMLQGECVLTYNWGNNFKRYLEEGSVIRGKYGVAPTPGSTRVLDRDTMELVKCTKEICPFGEEFPDIGWVNRAPYMAFGGWACAVNNYTDSVSKRLATEFCAFAASKQESIKAIIPNATAGGVNGQDPFRMSHLDIEDYMAAGYERDTAMQYIETLSKGLSSENVVTDIRFPKSSDIYNVLDYEYFHYLRARRNGTISDADAAFQRREVGEGITEQWDEIIGNYNGRLPILEAYQRLRDAYTPDVNFNQLGSIRVYGYILVTIIFMCSVGFGTWSMKYRSSQIVRASQPFFLVMICAGTMVLGASIIPLGIDDGDSSPLSCSLEDSGACDMACMAVPWCLMLGWSIVFSALFSKLWRVNIVYKHSMHFRRLKVSEKDVLLPFAVMFSTNVLLLLLWTILDPLFWSRIAVSDTETYGTCNVSKHNAWKSILIVLGLVNGTALVLANIEAYKARRITTEYGESKHIAMIMASILQVIIVGLPLMFLVDDNPAASYFIRSSIVFVICMSTLTLIFVPKIITWWNKKDARKMAATVTTGLRFQIYDSPELVAERAAKLDEYRLKVLALEELMKERGYEASDLFKEVGLNDISTVEASRYQPYGKTSASRENALSSAVSDYEQPLANFEKKTTSETAVSSASLTLERAEQSPNLDNKTAAKTVSSEFLTEVEEGSPQLIGLESPETEPDLENNSASPSLPHLVLSAEEAVVEESPPGSLIGEGTAPDSEGKNDYLSEQAPFDESSSSLNGDGAEPDLEGNHDFMRSNIPPPVL